MLAKYRELEMPLEANLSGLSIVAENGVLIGQTSASQKVAKCSSCLHETEYTGGHQLCVICGAVLNLPASESVYSYHEPDLMTGFEGFGVQPKMPVVNDDPRMPCRNVLACIRTEHGSRVVVDLINISRGGVCFMSFAQFRVGDKLSIATYFIEGGHNIFQEGRIVRMEGNGSDTSPREYGVGFANRKRIGSLTGARAQVKA